MLYFWQKNQMQYWPYLGQISECLGFQFLSGIVCLSNEMLPVGIGGKEGHTHFQQTCQADRVGASFSVQRVKSLSHPVSVQVWSETQLYPISYLQSSKYNCRKCFSKHTKGSGQFTYLDSVLGPLKYRTVSLQLLSFRKQVEGKALEGCRYSSKNPSRVGN